MRVLPCSMPTASASVGVDQVQLAGAVVPALGLLELVALAGGPGGPRRARRWPGREGLGRVAQLRARLTARSVWWASWARCGLVVDPARRAGVRRRGANRATRAWLAARSPRGTEA